MRVYGEGHGGHLFRSIRVDTVSVLLVDINSGPIQSRRSLNMLNKWMHVLNT